MKGRAHRQRHHPLGPLGLQGRAGDLNALDGAADDERTKDRNSAAFADCDLVPNVLAGVADIDMRVKVMGKTIDMPLMLSPTALQPSQSPAISRARRSAQIGARTRWRGVG